jgi:hypothetical protein
MCLARGIILSRELQAKNKRSAYFGTCLTQPTGTLPFIWTSKKGTLQLYAIIFIAIFILNIRYYLVEQQVLSVFPEHVLKQQRWCYMTNVCDVTSLMPFCVHLNEIMFNFVLSTFSIDCNVEDIENPPLSGNVPTTYCSTIGPSNTFDGTKVL